MGIEALDVRGLPFGLEITGDVVLGVFLGYNVNAVTTGGHVIRDRTK